MNDPSVLRFFFDYVDPASFLLERRIHELEATVPFSLVLEPFELSPPPSSLIDPEEEVWDRHWQAMEEEGLEMGLGLRRPWIVPWSRKSHELAWLAKKEGCFPEIHDTLFRAYLTEGVDIGRVDILVDLARGHGLDPLETKAALDVDLHSDAIVAKRREALEAGVAQPPTLLWRGRRKRGYLDSRMLREFLALEEQET